MRDKGDIQAHVRKKSMRMKTVNRHQDAVLRSKLDTLDRMAVVTLEDHLKNTKQVAETLKTCNKTTGFSRNGLKPEREDTNGCLMDLKTMMHPWTYFSKYTIESWGDNASVGVKSNTSSPSVTPRSKTSASGFTDHPPGLNRASETSPRAIRPSTVGNMRPSAYLESKLAQDNNQAQRPKTSGVDSSIRQPGREFGSQRPKTTGANKRLLLRRSAKIHSIPEDKECKTVSWGCSAGADKAGRNYKRGESPRIDSVATKSVTQNRPSSGDIDLPDVNGHAQMTTHPRTQANNDQVSDSESDTGEGSNEVSKPDKKSDLQTIPTTENADPTPELKPRPTVENLHSNPTLEAPPTAVNSDPTPDTKPIHQTGLNSDSSPDPKPLEVDALRPNPIRRLTLTPRPNPHRKVETPRILKLIDPSFYDDDPARVFTPKMIRPDRPKFHVRPQDRHKSEDMFLMRRYMLLQRQMLSDAPAMSDSRKEITVSFSHSARKKALDQMIEDNTHRRHEEKRQVQQSDIQTRVDGFLDALKDFVKQNNSSPPVRYRAAQQSSEQQQMQGREEQEVTAK